MHGRSVNQAIDMRTPMESFVVRVYRCHGGKKQQLVGVVEAPGLAGSKTFTSVAQLWEILSERASVQRAKARVKPADGQRD